MRRKTEGGTGGFTLLEILVALAVMSIAVTLVLQLFSANLRTVYRAHYMTTAAIRGEDRMREILLEPVLLEKSWSETGEDGYRFDISVAEVLKERTDNLPVRLMEVVLTIHWSEGPKEKSFTLKSQKMMDKNAGSEKKYAARD